jgi:diguanylate cyclase (GGDEF)-like protein
MAERLMKPRGILQAWLRHQTLPVFSAWAAGTVAFVLFVALSAVVFAYRMSIHDPSMRPEGLPWLLLIGMGITCVGFAVGVAWFTGRQFRLALDKLSTYLVQPNADDLDDVSFVELRRLRASVSRNVARLKRENEKLRQLAYVDRLTGLATPTRLENYIDETLGLARFETPAAYILVDINNFSRIADQIGAVRSEQVIAIAATRLTKALEDLTDAAGAARRGALLAHLHGDCFAVYLPNAISRQHAAEIARAIARAFSAPVQVDDHRFDLSVSGGIVMAPEDCVAALRLRPYAELAVKQSRKEHGSGFQFFSPNLIRVERGRYTLETELRQAVEARAFIPHFQPKIDLATGRIAGAEALARWTRANGTLTAPSVFIPLAEETGLIVQIGEHILEEACRAAKSWSDAGHAIAVAVNVSPRQFQRSDFSDMVISVLKRTGLPAALLELEITESMAVADPEKVADVMRPLRALGIQLAIDDFGTGHSNLAQLTRLPFDVFKIDRQFVSVLETDPQAPAIVEMILAMAESLGLKTVAEGVETARQAEFLRRRGCTIGQGYLYSPGVPASAFADLLNAWRVSSGAASAGQATAGLRR